MFVPSQITSSEKYRPNDPANFDRLSQSSALDMTHRLITRAKAIEAERPNAVSICRSSAEIREAMAAGRIAMLLHIEGAEAIDSEFKALEELYAEGLRSLGIVWSRANIFGEGAPMCCPSSPDTGPELTDAGKELVRACKKLGVLVDL